MGKKKKKRMDLGFYGFQNGVSLVACLDCLMIINVVYLDDLF